MKHFLLKFNHGVEIGAYLAYLGHANRTNTPKIYDIAQDEVFHRLALKHILEDFTEKPSPFIDGCFTFIGNIIKFLCIFMPLWSLNLVARSMEVFAVFSYENLKVKYPQYSETFACMAEAERDHEEYFRVGPRRYNELQKLRESLQCGRL